MTHTETARYRRVEEVEAIQWTGDNADALRALCGPDFDEIDPEDRTEDPDETAAVRTHPHGGWLGMTPGDWVLKREGHFTALSDADFARLYEPAGVAPATDQTAQQLGRAALSAKLWKIAEQHIVAEWICCEPLEPRHTLCAKGYAALGMVRTLLVDSPEAWNPEAPLLNAVLAELEQLRRERDLAIAHDRQPYPTAWAYEQVCKARTKHQERADAAEAVIAAVRAKHKRRTERHGSGCVQCGIVWPCQTYRELAAVGAGAAAEPADETKADPETVRLDEDGRDIETGCFPGCASQSFPDPGICYCDTEPAAAQQPKEA